MKEFIRNRLLEAIKSRHWKGDSYPTRILDSTLKDIDPKHKVEIDKRIAFIESLEFTKDEPQKMGIWIYIAPTTIYYPPFETRDKGHILLGIINNNDMTTLYWKHKKEGRYDYDITYEELVNFANSEFYDGKSKLVSIKSILAWLKSMRPKQEKPTVNVNRFKKIKLTDGSVLRYYEAHNKFTSFDGKEIELDDIFDRLPEDLQNKIIELP